MAKFYGNIGFIKTEEVEPGYWENKATERPYYGDITRNTSIVSDPYANENFQYMRYVDLRGTKWKITNAEVQYPRIILTLGGVYNG